MLDGFNQLLDAISWPIAILIIFFVLRRSFAGLIDRATKFSVGKDGLNIETLKQELEETKKTLAGTIAAGVPEKEAFVSFKETMKKPPGTLTEAKVKGGKFIKHSTALDVQTELKEKLNNPKDFVPNDPQKNQWGKLSVNKNRKLTATIEPMPGNTKLYKIKMEVISTSPADPLNGTVWFHLHPTFGNPEQEIKVINGKAELSLLSWGSFTVGVETDNRSIHLELDLAELSGISEEFRNT